MCICTLQSVSIIIIFLGLKNSSIISDIRAKGENKLQNKSKAKGRYLKGVMRKTLFQKKTSLFGTTAQLQFDSEAFKAFKNKIKILLCELSLYTVMKKNGAFPSSLQPNLSLHCCRRDLYQRNASVQSLVLSCNFAKDQQRLSVGKKRGCKMQSIHDNNFS